MIELGDHHIDAVKKGISIPSRRARDEISRYFGQSAFTCRPRPSTYLAVAQQRQPTEVMPAAGVGDLSCEVFQAKAQSFGQAGREIRVAHHFVDAIELEDHSVWEINAATQQFTIHEVSRVPQGRTAPCSLAETTIPQKKVGN